MSDLSEDKRLFELVEEAFSDPPRFYRGGMSDAAFRAFEDGVKAQSQKAKELARSLGLEVPG